VSPLLRARLAGEIIWAYVQVRRGLRRKNLPAVLSDLRAVAPTGGGRPLGGSSFDGGRLGHAVVRTLEPLPFDSRCLMRSLVLLRVLSRRGVSGELVVAVRPEERDRLGAHAWVEVDGTPLLAPAGPDHGRLVTL